MKKYLLGDGGHFFRANLHCHTTCSDGRYSPEQIKQKYRERGYSIVAFSDHNAQIPHTELCAPDFLPLTATEIDFNEPAERWSESRVYHLNFYSPEQEREQFPEFVREYSVDAINDLIARANAQGYLVQYNHPRWSYQQASDFLALEGLWGIEVYNHGCQTEMMNGWGDYEFEVCCRAGMRPVPVATDDNHNVYEDDASPFSDLAGGWSMIEAEELTYDGVFEAMRQKRMYATTGPEIGQIWVEDGVIHVTTSPVCGICFLTSGRETGILRAHGDVLTHHTFTIPTFVKYVRVELTDSKGGKAFSRPYDISELL